MNRKSVLIPALAAALLAASFLAPGAADRAMAAAGPARASARPLEARIKIWCGANEPENAAMVQIAADYEKQTGVHVDVVGRTTIFTSATDLVNSAKLDDGPDIVYLQAPDIGSLAVSGYLQPLDIPKSLRSRFVDAAFDAFTLNGTCYGVGYNVSAYGLIYNKQLISQSELPKTWAEFFDTAKRLTIKDASGKYVQRGTLFNARNMWFVYPIMREFGGYYYGRYQNGSINVFDIGLNNAGMLDYVRKMKELKNEGLVLDTRLQSESDIVNAFGAGKVAMILYGLWSADYFQKAGVEYGIAPLPAHGNGTSSKPLTTVEGFVINRYSRHPEEARAFLDYILSDTNQQTLIEAGNGGDAKTGARNPANLSVIRSDYIQGDEILRSFSRIGMDCEPFPNVPEGTIWYHYTTTTFGSIFYGDSKGKEVDASKALGTMVGMIRADVAQMNKSADRVPFQWWYYGIPVALLAAGLAVAAVRAGRRARRMRGAAKTGIKAGATLLCWALLLPMLVLLGMFYVYPIIHNIALSVSDYSGIHLNDYGFVGLANYRSIFTSGIGGLLGMSAWTLAFATSVVCLSFLLGTYMATVLDRTNVKVARVYRVIYILPWVIPAVITLLMWQGLLETDGGLVNQLLHLFGLPSVPWLSDARWARVSAILVMVWFSFPYYMVVANGMLKAIPRDYYEAARIDGAGRLYEFWKITLPMVLRAMLPTLVMGFIMQFNQFGIYLLTQGGPPSDTLGAPGATDLLITYIFNTAFNTKRYALAAAYSVILFVFIGLFTLAVMRRNKKRAGA